MYFQEEIEYPFFVKHLYGEPSKPLSEAIFFETGANRWREFTQWPPNGLIKKTFYLLEHGGLLPRPATRNGIFVKFKSKPNDPVPYTTEDTARWGKQFMAEDQRFLDKRKDVLSFSTPILEKDTTIAGPIDAMLRVSTSRSSADWIVKVIDVFPEDGNDTSVADPGTKLMIRWEILRGRFRNDFSKPEPFVPGKVAEIPIHLQDVLHTFKKGHKIMIQVQSSFFPFFDRNPQNYVENIYHAKPRDFKKAVHKVFTGKDTPSFIVFGILPQE
jgi:putative CocE/NonD family hydrolase